MARIGFIGLGNMGSPMVLNLLKAGHVVRAFDLNPAALEASIAGGAVQAPSIADAVADAEFVVTMLPAGEHVRAVWTGADGIIEALRGRNQGPLLMDCSTIDVTSARAVTKAAEDAGLDALDAPVSGGVGGAVAGTLTFMVGGTPEAFARGRPVLADMGKSIVHTGAAGAGQAVKICNNMILAISMTGVAEGFALGVKLGVDPQKIYDVVSVSTGRCWALNDYCPEPGIVLGAPSSKDYVAGFTAALMLKDLKLSQDAAASVDAPTGLGAAATKLFQRTVDAGESAKDFSVIRRWLSKQGRKDVVS
ncbi:MAG: 3-hydroxyisobutyrate dehydrogenase [Acetobacteraceae bacterium]|nr:3-hydroxyisobutyrate dehydrogenase [Acetobacteraceae bacterium]MSP28907.1 3-hydroxyisobutyrate dehydrogenase [Acetobacteraceae bacterium]